MINIISNQPSGRALQQAVADINTDKIINIAWGARVYPTPQADSININCIKRKDSREQLEALDNAGLIVPEWTNDLETAKQWVRDGIKVWGRRWFHTRGNDVIGSGYKYRIKTKTESWNPTWLKREWWVQVIPNNLIVNEWRIHIFQGRSIGRGLKVQTGDAVRVQPVRNRDNGWTLVHNVDPSPYVRNAAAVAVKAVGYNFGAVDLFELADNQCVILEVNSAPALGSDYTFGIYHNAISKLAAGKWLEWRDKDFTKDNV
jgi:hypothetical protein